MGSREVGSSRQIDIQLHIHIWGDFGISIGISSKKGSANHPSEVVETAVQGLSPGKLATPKGFYARMRHLRWSEHSEVISFVGKESGSGRDHETLETRESPGCRIALLCSLCFRKREEVISMNLAFTKSLSGRFHIE